MTKVTLVEPGDEGPTSGRIRFRRRFLVIKELIDYVQAVMGLAAIGHVYVEALIIAYGDGHNGKSTFFNSMCTGPGFLFRINLGRHTDSRGASEHEVGDHRA
jgi:hypothetical protein